MDTEIEEKQKLRWRLEEGEKFRGRDLQEKSYGGGKKKERSSGGGSRKERSFGGGISKKRSYGGGKKTERSSSGGLSRGEEEPVGGDAPLVLVNGVVATENMNRHFCLSLFFSGVDTTKEEVVRVLSAPQDPQ
ncbi:hypothetical protein F2Q69_00052876 [Brassica cretica]|uniref:Uncharacterized protein n=1 Tax=Brassica cretica TaxID=69181 RepID=A0A8S9N1H5_BRACR|nr:hypothetical protein F2Q69_00052876 [Brassica cretica]